jgi:hypothetical protein
MGGAADIREMSDEQIAAFLPHLVGTGAAPRLALAPLVSHRGVDARGFIDPATVAEAGLALFPAGGPSPAATGLAVGPYSRGSLAAKHSPAPGWEVAATGSIGAIGGAVFKFLPGGNTLATGVGTTAASGSFGIDLVIRDPAGGKMVLIGEPGSSRVEIEAATLSVGGRMSTGEDDFYVAAGVTKLGAVIDVGGDGLLSSLLNVPISLSAGDLLLGWRYRRGVYFEGGANFAITIPVDIEIGPVRLSEIGLSLDLKPKTAIGLTVSADLTIGPVFASAEGLGIRTTLVPAKDGILLGRYDLGFGFIPPTGYALAIDASPLKGGGLVSVNGSEYRGALALSFEKIGFSAFAILDTQLPGGKPGFSLAASIFASFTMPLGFGFFLTGLGGVIGINRTIDVDALRQVLYAGRLDNLLFPADPIATAARILDDMAAILPAREGQHLFGPVAKISWGQPALVDVKLGVVIEVGNQVRLLILGGLSSSLPTKEAALVVLNLSFFGEIDFAAGTISFDASLEGSRVLSFAVSGDVAIRTGWAKRLDHVAAFGGLHPQYPRPRNLPELRRLSINFGTNNPSLTLTAYAAMTLNSLQFGARADLYAKGPKIPLVGRVAAEGHIYFDALIYFNPFAFDVRLGGGLSLLVDGDVVAGLGFDLRLRGPNTFHIDGRVWVTIFRIDVEFRISHSWGQPQTLGAATVDGAAELRKAIAGAGRFEPLAPKQRMPAVSFRQSDDVSAAIDPMGGIRLVERAVPLGVRIDKIGEAQLAGARTFDLKVMKGAAQVGVAPASEDFVRGHFFNLSEAERLRSPAFEPHRAGFQFAPDVLAFNASAAIVESYEYEVIQLPVAGGQSAQSMLAKHATLAADFAVRFMDAHHEHLARPAETLAEALRPMEAVTVQPMAFMPAAAARDAAAAGPLRAMATLGTLSDARRRVGETADAAAATGGGANPVLASYIAGASFKAAA